MRLTCLPQDSYKIVLENECVTDPQQLCVLLKKEMMDFPRVMGWGRPTLLRHTTQRDAVTSVRGRALTAKTQLLKRERCMPDNRLTRAV